MHRCTHTSLDIIINIIIKFINIIISQIIYYMHKHPHATSLHTHTGVHTSILIPIHPHHQPLLHPHPHAQPQPHLQPKGRGREDAIGRWGLADVGMYCIKISHMKRHMYRQRPYTQKKGEGRS